MAVGLKNLGPKAQEIKERQAKVLDYKVKGLKVKDIAVLMGVREETIFRDIRAITHSDPIEAERQKFRPMLGIARAVFLDSMVNQEGHVALKAAGDVTKITGVWTDKLDITVEKKLTDAEMREKAAQLLTEIRQRVASPAQLDKPSTESKTAVRAVEVADKRESKDAS